MRVSSTELKFSKILVTIAQIAGFQDQTVVLDFFNFFTGKADDFITVSGKTAQNIVAAESNQRFTDRCFAAAKLFYQFFFV